jgi:hypothetical protein
MFKRLNDEGTTIIQVTTLRQMPSTATGSCGLKMVGLPEIECEFCSLT